MDSRDWSAMTGGAKDEFILIIYAETGALRPGGDCDEEISLPTKWEVCSLCGGKGTHVNPSIDSNGLTAEDFAEDPDFREDYFSGVYDQPCNECHGRTTVKVVDEDRMSPELIEAYRQQQQDEYQMHCEREAEIRMGC